VLDADALLIDDDMPKVLNADALLPDDDNNDARWHDTVMAPFCLFFLFFQKDIRDTRQLRPSQISL
jgi:hypothetical protein